MKETAHKLKSLTAFDISGDYLIGQFERLASDDEETAIDAYTNIARYLLTNDITLADYLRELLTYADSKLIESYIRKEDTNKQYAVEYDVSVIKELAKTGITMILVGSQAEGLSFPEVQREFYFLAPRICDRRL